MCWQTRQMRCVCAQTIPLLLMLHYHLNKIQLVSKVSFHFVGSSNKVHELKWPYLQ